MLEKHFETERSSSMNSLFDTKAAQKVPVRWRQRDGSAGPYPASDQVAQRG
jgi:hypothetical protein